MVNDYWQNARGASAVAAFTQVPDASLDAYNQVRPATSTCARNNAAAQPYAATVADVLGSASQSPTWEATGYASVPGSAALKGYTQGPRYWGKTFFVWPPDPNNDWRQLYFGNGTAKSGGTTPVNNTKLWDSSGNWQNPGSSTYTINYKNILAWIKAQNIFPPTLRSGGILFYSTIPTDVPASAYDPTQPNSAITNQDQRFWKEYIDYTVGVWKDPNGTSSTPADPCCSYGPDYTFGTVKVTRPRRRRPASHGKTVYQYMNYLDNPERPRHRLWFGPMTMIQYLSDTGNLPGTSHDISIYPMKTGIGGALQDIQNNHPNDLVAMVPFNRPQFANDCPPGRATSTTPSSA